MNSEDVFPFFVAALAILFAGWLVFFWIVIFDIRGRTADVAMLSIITIGSITFFAGLVRAWWIGK